MDVLYYIGCGSHHNNDELRYSLRSLHQHCQDVDRVFVVGNKPAFLRNVQYLWVEDKFEWWRNAFEKTKAAINAGISDEFLLMNDDFFMTSDFKAAKYPFYHRGEMPSVAQNKYQEVIVQTKKILQGLNASLFHYGVHCPIRIEAKKYLELEKYFTHPVSARCLYGNLFCKGIRTDDNKGTILKNSKQKCFSSADWAGEDTFEALKKLFDQPSRWEEENV